MRCFCCNEENATVWAPDDKAYCPECRRVIRSSLKLWEKEDSAGLDTGELPMLDLEEEGEQD